MQGYSGGAESIRLEGVDAHQGGDVEEEHRCAYMDGGAEHDAPCCYGNGDQHDTKGDEAGSALEVVPTGASIIEEVRFVALPTIAHPMPTGEDHTLLARFDGLHHVDEQLEFFFRGSGGK